MNEPESGNATKSGAVEEHTETAAEAAPAKGSKRKNKHDPIGGFADFVKAWCTSQGLRMPALHKRIAVWLGKHWRARTRPKRMLLLAFRGAGKSTLVGLFAAWLLARDPSLRILTLSADLALARKMVRNVKRLIESHPATKGLKPKKPELWSGEQFTVARAALLRDPSMLARGLDGNFTGSRADVVICDDVEVPGNSDTPAKRAALREKLGEIEFVLTPDGAQLYLGTPHTYYSIYAAAARAETGEARPFLAGFAREEFPVYAKKTSRPAWPQRFPKEAIEARRRAAGQRRFDSQMMLMPVAPEGCRLDAGKLLGYSGEVEYREAQGQGSLWLEGRRLASLRVWWDPAYGRTVRASRNAVAAVYQDVAGGYWLHRLRYFAVDAAAAKDDPGGAAEADQLCRAVALFVEELGAASITVEDNGLGQFVPGLLRKALAEIGSRAGVVAHHARVSKGARILKAFDVTLAAGLLHAHRSVCEGPFVEEMREWQPLGKSGRHDDALDAVAGAILAEPTRLGPYPRPPGAPAGERAAGERAEWRASARTHQAATDFTP